jgi:hypothetical protein
MICANLKRRCHFILLPIYTQMTKTSCRDDRCSNHSAPKVNMQ